MAFGIDLGCWFLVPDNRERESCASEGRVSKCMICVNQKREQSKKVRLCFAFKTSFVFFYFVVFLISF